jgi:cytochrome P450
VSFVTVRQKAATAIGKRYGTTFTLRLPVLGTSVVIGDPVLLKDLFTTSSGLDGRAPNLGPVIGPGTLFSLDGDEHRARRKLLMPSLHGKRMKGYEHIIEEEVMGEVAHWPEGEEFETFPSMMRITLNAILRAVFGASGAALDELRELLPPMVSHGSWVAVLPPIARRDLGPWSPGGRLQVYRRRYDAVIQRLISDARSDLAFDHRQDVLALMLQARYDNGEPISHEHIADELLGLLTAGHETTATTLAWAVERMRPRPQLLDRLTEEVDAGGSELRQATIFEVQRNRPVLDVTFRRTRTRIRLGEWVIPANTTIIVGIGLAHASEDSFPDASSFNPDRFVGNPPNTSTWVPYGGGVRRCIGAAFANMEIDVTLRTLLRELTFAPTNAAAEPIHSRGVTTAPGHGGRAVVYRRNRAEVLPASAAQSVEVTAPSSPDIK